MPGPPRDASTLSFGEFCLDLQTATLTRQGVPVPLEPQPAAVLVRLASARGELVAREELIEVLWRPSNTHVNYNDGLNYCVRQVRVALGDDARAPRFVATIPRQGYRFIARLTPDTGSRLPPWRVFGSYGAAAAALLWLVVIETRPNTHHEVMVGWLRAIHAIVF